MQDFERHRELLDAAGTAPAARRLSTPFPEIPGGKIHGGSTRGDRLAPLGIRYPAMAPAALVAGSESAAAAARHVAAAGRRLTQAIPKIQKGGYPQ